jgi:hypothetical protein
MLVPRTDWPQSPIVDNITPRLQLGQISRLCDRGHPHDRTRIVDAPRYRSSSLTGAAMNLCDVCRKIDIRELLQLALLEHDPKAENSETECRLCSLLDNGIPHHHSYAALRAAAEHGCEFCGLVRHALLEEKGERDSISKETPKDEGEWHSVPVVFHIDHPPNSVAFKGYLPSIKVRVGLQALSKLTCNLEAFAPRGMLI